MKNVVKLDTYYFPWELKLSISGFVHYYNNEHYHESLQNLRHSNVYFGRRTTILGTARASQTEYPQFKKGGKFRYPD